MSHFTIGPVHFGQLSSTASTPGSSASVSGPVTSIACSSIGLSTHVYLSKATKNAYRPNTGTKDAIFRGTTLVDARTQAYVAQRGVVYGPGVRVVGKAWRAIKARRQRVIAAQVVPQRRGRQAFLRIAAPAQEHKSIRAAPLRRRGLLGVARESRG